jgi:GntR family transcriptional regulator, transcriptional repressor for pyruvate dehydrogenase complex
LVLPLDQCHKGRKLECQVAPGTLDANASVWFAGAYNSARAMAFRVISPRRIYQEIALQIRDHIENGEFASGSRLPSERELAQQLKVSRPSIREALIALEVEGLVEVRTGAGVFVCKPKRTFPYHASSEGPLEIMRARISIEGETAALAARYMRTPQIRELTKILEAMDPDLHPDEPHLPADRAFHLYIAENAGNSVLVRIVAELFDARHSPLGLQFGKHFENIATWRQALAEHQLVVKALASRNPQAAREAMQTHLRRAHNRLTRRIEKREK